MADADKDWLPGKWEGMVCSQSTTSDTWGEHFGGSDSSSLRDQEFYGWNVASITMNKNITDLYQSNFEVSIINKDAFTDVVIQEHFGGIDIRRFAEGAKNSKPLEYPGMSPIIPVVENDWTYGGYNWDEVYNSATRTWE